MNLQDVVMLSGYVAAAVLFVRLQKPARSGQLRTAVTANVAFIAYGIICDVVTLAVLHAILLPLNTRRLWELAIPRQAALPAVKADLRGRLA